MTSTTVSSSDPMAGLHNARESVAGGDCGCGGHRVPSTTDGACVTAAGRPPVEATPAHRHPPAGPLAAILDQLRALLAGMTDAQYTQKPVGAFGSSIGGQTRHTLDHVSALLRGRQAGRFDYDHRERGTDVETCRSAAMVTLNGLRAELLALTAADLDQPVSLSVMLASDGASIEMTSCVGRELAFVQSHTIHHNAMIAAMAQHLGVPVPDRFGYAPSTVAYLDGQRSAEASAGDHG